MSQNPLPLPVLITRDNILIIQKMSRQVSFSKVGFSKLSNSTSAARNGSRPYSHSAEQLLAIPPEKTVRIDMTVKRLACDAQRSRGSLGQVARPVASFGE